MDSIERVAVDPRADDVVVIRPGHVEYTVVGRNPVVLEHTLVVKRTAVRQRTPAMEQTQTVSISLFAWYDLVMGCAVTVRPAP